MIKLLEDGNYTLIETHKHIKILNLGKGKVFVWINAAGIGEILVASHKPHKTDHILAVGRYRLYQVKDEAKLTDLIHLELLVGEGIWQGYLLTKGLPQANTSRVRIIPTLEIITKSVN
ncbi:MAG: hypothetical protein A3D74_05515 [Candidatus Levybacteria bacterium RIFCSPHIGHO2_02_FULL_37_13]|nr:MAG: hypothetical protein A3D74_05515 [Candidatus Levybacteria bacterium RIFCSPHIGHO2_02_FULL_37_13]OGH40402.1 MAG: hypothetical protein A3B41_02740 [Candidatus Levybacteria bacterium RIFCSPLOWO2_01_FULL_37_26]